MALIQWDNSMSVGVASLDAQHQKLIDIINTLHTAMRSGHGKEVVVRTLVELKEYTRIHFADEERLLKLYQFPALQDQIDRHKWFVEKLTSFQRATEAGELATPIELMDFLSNWLVRHIQKSDMAYSELLREKGVN